MLHMDAQQQTCVSCGKSRSLGQVCRSQGCTYCFFVSGLYFFNALMHRYEFLHMHAQEQKDVSCGKKQVTGSNMQVTEPYKVIFVSKLVSFCSFTMKIYTCMHQNSIRTKKIVIWKKQVTRSGTCMQVTTYTLKHFISMLQGFHTWGR